MEWKCIFRRCRDGCDCLCDAEIENLAFSGKLVAHETAIRFSTEYFLGDVNFNLRKPAVHKIFGLKRSELGSGVTELLAGKISWQDALSEETGQENLSCIFAGVKAPNPGELLSSDAVSNLLEQ